jgi:hypothetical protein
MTHKRFPAALAVPVLATLPALAKPKLTTALKPSGQTGEFEMQATYTTDGQESANQGFGGSSAMGEREQKLVPDKQ